MLKKVLIILLLVGIFSMSGCIDNNSSSGYSSGSGTENCGDLNEYCCEWFGEDEFGQFTARYYCNDYLECRAGICVEGPDYQSAGRP
ncbi:MAG: hypothetical protein GF368_02750 [Candidatus Aenigmarchaeota archaeon]|nr:hypothetical protein [Candidatus Aenigmarchaeota archaeon]